MLNSCNSHRFIAAEDKFLFVFSMESLVDFFTVPPVFLSGECYIVCQTIGYLLNLCLRRPIFMAQ